MNELQKKVKSVCEDWGIDNTLPEFRYIDLVSELGELGKEILKGSTYGESPLNKTLQLQEELGDTFFSLICLANALSIDLEEELEKVMSKYHSRMKEKRNIGSD